MPPPPVAIGAFPAYEMRVGDELPMDLSGAFTGDALAFAASSSDESAATVAVAGATATVTALAAGVPTITLRATNTGGSIEQAVSVTVQDIPPTAGSLPDIALTIGGEDLVVDATPAFMGSALAFAASVSGDAVAVDQSGGHIRVSPLVEGEATIRVSASNTAGRASLSFKATVSTDHAETEALEHSVAALARSTLASITSAVGTRFRAERNPAASGPDLSSSAFSGTNTLGLLTQSRVPLASAGPLALWPQQGAGLHAGFQGGPGAWSQTKAPFSMGGGIGQLVGKSFALPLNATGTDGGTGSAEWTFWGQVDRQSFDGARQDGDVTSVYLGADGNFGESWLAGVAISRSSSNADYEFTGTNASGRGDLDTEMVAVLPYVRWSLDDKSEFWAIVGAGWGDMDHERSGTDQRGEAELSMWMLSTGGRTVLNAAADWNLALTGDAGILEMDTDAGLGIISDMNVSVSRVKLALEGERMIVVDGSEMFSVFGQIGGRHDSGDGDTGSGVELMGGLRYDGAGRISIEAKARLLGLHSADDYEETGLSLSASVRPRLDGSGLSLSISSYLGTGMRTNHSLGQTYGYSDRMRDFDPEMDAWGDAWGMDASIGYTLRTARFAGLITPFANFDMAGNDGHGMRLGLRYDFVGGGSGAMFNLEFTGGQEYDRWRNEANNRVQVRGELRF